MLRANRKSVEHVRRELATFLAEHDLPRDTMPSTLMLRQHGLNSMVTAACKFHGGIHGLATKLGVRCESARRGKWHGDEGLVALRTELMDILTAGGLLFRDVNPRDGTIGYMPHQAELQKWGRYEIVYAISKQGGVRTVARKLGLKMVRKNARQPELCVAPHRRSDGR